MLEIGSIAPDFTLQDQNGTAEQFESLRSALAELSVSEEYSVQPVFGGDINRAFRLTANGRNIFMKANRRENEAFFSSEITGLNAIRETKTIRVPETLAWGTDSRYGVFLLLEWCEGRQSREFFENFGHQLAAMHRADTSKVVKGYGFPEDNFIGAGKQENTPEESWVVFFRDHRLKPQFQRTDSWFESSDRKRIGHLLDHLEEYLPEPAFPSLLHGDLWSGNFLVGNDGEAWLIDPAVYVGHAEADLAMTELFGGFPQRFYGAYSEANPIDPGFRGRRDIYNLYHLLNHLNLFGGSYLGSVREVLSKYKD